MESRFVKNGAGLLRNNYRKDHVYDEIDNIKAQVSNGIWNIEEYITG